MLLLPSQIDLDLARTLPTNKLFDNETSEKAQSLRRVLYAFRFHNKSVEYCQVLGAKAAHESHKLFQGLNRLAAIGLLYLSEADAFWFLVACVEHLQPPDYYTPSLLGAVADQKVEYERSNVRHLPVRLGAGGTGAGETPIALGASATTGSGAVAVHPQLVPDAVRGRASSQCIFAHFRRLPPRRE